jgi:hypothetical protein
VVAVDLLIVFLSTISLEFLAERFLAACAKDTLINEWLIPWVSLDKQMVNSFGLTLIKEWCIPWIGQVKRKRAGGKGYKIVSL